MVTKPDDKAIRLRTLGMLDTLEVGIVNLAEVFELAARRRTGRYPAFGKRSRRRPTETAGAKTIVAQIAQLASDMHSAAPCSTIMFRVPLVAGVDTDDTMTYGRGSRLRQVLVDVPDR